MIETTVLSRLAWAHGEAMCPSGRLPIDARDVDEKLVLELELEPTAAPLVPDLDPMSLGSGSATDLVRQVTVNRQRQTAPWARHQTV
jgi:hypothetical protein